MQNSALMFSMLLTVLTREKVSKRYLAEKYEVCERTVARYMASISAMGVPVYSIKGRGGGYAIDAEFKFDKSYFGENEITRIIECLKNDTERADKLNDMIVDKLQYMSRRKKDEQYLLQTDSLIIDAGTWSNPALYRAKMETIQKAINAGKSLNIMYVDRYEARTHRLFDPYYRILKDGVWYAYGWCHSRRDFRLFKLARIKSIQETDQTFERRECNVYEKLDGGFDDFDTVDLEIEFSSIILADIEEWLGLDAIHERGYKYVATARVYSGNVLLKKLMSFGSSIKILAPTDLRDEVLAECKRIIRNAE